MATIARVDVDFKQALGQLIVVLRGEGGLSQEKLALAARVDRTRMGEIERGEANPTLDTVARIAGALDQTVGTLILQAEELASGTTRRPAPTVNPAYIDRQAPLPAGLTAVTKARATARLRANSVYLDPAYATREVRKAIRERQQDYLF